MKEKNVIHLPENNVEGGGGGEQPWVRLFQRVFSCGTWLIEFIL